MAIFFLKKFSVYPIHNTDNLYIPIDSDFCPNPFYQYQNATYY